MPDHKIIEADFTFEPSHHKDLGHLGVTPVHAIREFVDNSTSSFYDHEGELNKLGTIKCVVNITWNDEKMIIEDNAFGMNEEEILRAIKPGEPPKKISKTSRNLYGLGFNYAAVTIGDIIEIKTYQPNNNVNYYSKIDINEVSDKKMKTIPVNSFDVVDKTDHYTVIIISQLKYKYSDVIKTRRSQQDLDILFKQLSVIYAFDIKRGKLEININGQKVPSFEPELAKNESGVAIVRRFEDCKFEFNGREYNYSGWASILERGSTKTEGVNGFSLIQKNRAIVSFYRPTDLFGSGNNRAIQRVIGEIYLDSDEWKPSFTKNSVDLSGGLEDAFISSLKSNAEIKYIIKEARKTKKSKPSTTVDVINMKFGEQIDKNKEKFQEKTENHSQDESVNGIEQNNQILPEYAKKIFIIDNKEYKLFIKPAGEDSILNNAFEVSKKNNEYYLIINDGIAGLKHMNKETYYKLISYLVVSELASKTSGVRDEHAKHINDNLNKLLEK